MSDEPLRVLFVCRENACRSQMAEGLARHLGRGRVHAASAGSRARGRVDETAIRVMAQRGIDLAAQRSKGLDQVPAEGWDVVVGMGCGDACPRVPGAERLEWAIDDPAGQPVETYREVRDAIERHVRALLAARSIVLPPDSSSSGAMHSPPPAIS